MTAIAAPTIRKPAVAGLFYPGEAATLAAEVDGLLAVVRPMPGSVPKAIIVPHAGYQYSGPIAATAYARLAPARHTIRRVVLLGPAHREWFQGMALPSVTQFRTPLGDVPLDGELAAQLAGLPGVVVRDDAHRLEHSLEVHLPFLQRLLDRFTLLPIAVSEASAGQVARVLAAAWGGRETLIVISSDLSHYHDYATARGIDAGTAAAIEMLDGASLDGERACGYLPVQGLLLEARSRGMTVARADLRSSGDTAGPRGEVVGYGAWTFAEPQARR